MLRAALAAVVLAVGLIASALQAAPAPAWPAVAATAAPAHVVDDCTDAGGAEWHATPALAASTLQSSTWRGIQAASGTAADACAFVAAAPRSRAGIRATSPPAHLRHTPLLI